MNVSESMTLCTVKTPQRPHYDEIVQSFLSVVIGANKHLG
jgi:hypothetical protein